MRRKYVDVISYFAIAITLSGLQIFVMHKVGLDLEFYDTSTELGKRQQEMFEGIYKITTEYQSLVLMSYIPVYALISGLVFRRYKKFNYTELLVVFLYTQAPLSIVFALAIPLLVVPGIVPLVTIGTIGMPLQFICYIYALKRVFGLSARQMFWRTMLFLLLFLILFILFSIVFAVFMIRSGMFENV